MKTKFQYVLVEVGVIVIGLLIALRIDSWYEAYKERKLEHSILKEIRTSVELDLLDINNALALHENAVMLCDSVSELLLHKTYDKRIARQLDIIFRDITFAPNRAPFESLKSIGVNLISNDSIRLKIAELYEEHYHTIVDYEEGYPAAQFWDKFYRFIITNFEDWEFEKRGNQIIKSTPKDFNSLKRNSELRIMLSMRRIEHREVMYFYKMTSKNIKSLILIIDKELSN